MISAISNLSGNAEGKLVTRVTRPSGEFTTSDGYAFARDLNQFGEMTWKAFDFTSTSKPA